MNRPASLPWWIFLVDGLLLILGGLLMLSFPFASTLGLVAWIGAFLLIAGTVGTIRSLRHGDHGPTGLTAVASIVCGLVGLFMLIDPPAMAGGLAVLGGLYFLVSGAYQVGGAILDSQLPHRAMTGIVGIVSLIAGVACVANPATLVWVFGIVFGVQLIFAGFQTIALGSAVRRMAA
jgi:uncharacterized membrane protein HdeD (DUF308 family)